jgi:hypothetical protein
VSNWGVASLHQGLPDEFRSVPVGWNPIDQPRPRIKEREQQRGCAGEIEAGNLLHARDVLLQGLEQAYILESRPETEQFLRIRPTVITLLVEAAAHIDAAFGTGRIKAIRLVHDGFETSVFGIVFWPESAESGGEALARFDQSWWLQNCTRASGVVNFNIELA